MAVVFVAIFSIAPGDEVFICTVFLGIHKRISLDKTLAIYHTISFVSLSCKVTEGCPMYIPVKRFLPMSIFIRLNLSLYVKLHRVSFRLSTRGAR